MKSGYILAGFETFASIVDNFLLGKKGRFQENFTREQLSNFLSKSISGFLHSFGQDFPGKRNYSKYNKREAELFIKCREMGFFDNCDFIADSGGFQISIGRLTREESDLLYRMYYEWLEEYYKVYDKAFILDVPPGPGCKIFKNFEDVYNLNLESYERAKNLPDCVRQKIIYVHHFRTPKLWEIYTKILRDYDMFNSFNYHATGGIVANMASDMTIPCIIYILPLIPLLNECKKFGKDHLNFHILGGSNFRDILFYELFNLVVKKTHNIDLNITYDSSAIYKQVMHARFMYVKDEEQYIRKINIKSSNLDKRFLPTLSVHDTCQKVFNELSEKWNFKNISIDGVYDEKTGTFFEDVKIYSMLYTFNLYSEVQRWMRDFALEIYPIFESGCREEFYRQCLEATRVLNQGQLTKKQIIKAHSIPRSLDMLIELDEDKCKDIVDKFLSKDEFTDLDEKTRILNA
jgi:hypothetical protein